MKYSELERAPDYHGVRHKLDQLTNRELVRAALMDEKRSTFFLTLNVNCHCPLTQCRNLLERLMYRVHRSVFRRRAYQGVPTPLLLHVIACALEKSKNGNPHMHVLVSVVDGSEEKFCRRVPRLWANLAPLGSSCVKPIIRTEDSIRALAWYVTKDTDLPALIDMFMFEVDLGMPAHGGQIQARRGGLSHV